MPQTESCILGAENKTRIDNIEQDIKEIRVDVHKLANDYSHRPTQTYLRVVAIMAGLLGASIGLIAALSVALVRFLT